MCDDPFSTMLDNAPAWHGVLESSEFFFKLALSDFIMSGDLRSKFFVPRHQMARLIPELDPKVPSRL